MRLCRSKFSGTSRSADLSADCWPGRSLSHTSSAGTPYLKYAIHVADHKIKMSIPDQILNGQDVTFSVHIDGTKRGELRVSEGGLDWWPAYAKTKVISKSWADLAKFMEE